MPVGSTIRIAPEVTQGVVDTSSGAAQVYQLAGGGESVGGTVDTARSSRYSEGRLPSPQFPTGGSTGGDFNGVMGVGTHDPLIPFAFWVPDWTPATPLVVTADLTIVASTRTITMIGAFASPTAVGDVFELSGATDAINNVRYRILTVTSDDEAIMETYHTAMVDQVTGSTATVTHGDYVEIGAIKTTVSYEKENIMFGGTSAFHMNTGCAFNSVNFTMATDGELEVTFNLLGLDEVTAAASLFVAPVAANTAAAVRSVSGLKGFFVKSTAASIDRANVVLRSWNMSLDNAVTQDKAQADEIANTTYDVRPGVSNPTGAMEIAYDDRAFVDAFLKFQDVSAMIDLSDPAGKGFVFVIDRLNFTDGGVDIGGENEPAVVNLPFSISPDTNNAFKLWRFAA